MVKADAFLPSIWAENTTAKSLSRMGSRVRLNDYEFTVASPNSGRSKAAIQSFIFTFLQPQNDILIHDGPHT